MWNKDDPTTAAAASLVARLTASARITSMVVSAPTTGAIAARALSICGQAPADDDLIPAPRAIVAIGMTASGTRMIRAERVFKASDPEILPGYEHWTPRQWLRLSVKHAEQFVVEDIRIEERAR